MRHRNTHQNGGFSLPEVAIAVAIAALGLVAILGLLPQGLEMSRKTGMLTAQRSIVEQVVRDLEQTQWSELLKLESNKQLRYFDDQGIDLFKSDHPSLTYIASVEVQGKAAKLPQVALEQEYLRKVIVKIATTRNTAFDFSDANSAKYSTFYHYIAKGR